MSRRSGGDEPTSIGDALAAVGRDLGMPATGAVTALERRWPEVVGEEVAEHATPSSVRDGVLTVVVDGPIWATQLRYLEAVILERAAAVTGDGVVTSVRVRVAGPETSRGGSRGTSRSTARNDDPDA
jgi:predicted nucleic acid-binding Zn ribbon protein